MPQAFYSLAGLGPAIDALLVAEGAYRVGWMGLYKISIQRRDGSVFFGFSDEKVYETCGAIKGKFEALLPASQTMCQPAYDNGK
jgi:hypothetical protein